MALKLLPDYANGVADTLVQGFCPFRTISSAGSASNLTDPFSLSVAINQTLKTALSDDLRPDGHGIHPKACRLTTDKARENLFFF